MNNPLYPNQSLNGTSAKDEAVTEAPAEVGYFHLVAAIAYYMRDGVTKQRTVNIMLETSSPNIARSDLDQVNQGVMMRVNAENNVQAEDMVDIVILNVSRLAVMPRDDFYKSSEPEQDAPES